MVVDKLPSRLNDVPPQLDSFVNTCLWLLFFVFLIYSCRTKWRENLADFNRKKNFKKINQCSQLGSGEMEFHTFCFHSNHRSRPEKSFIH
jgi:hypothetical protein